MHLASVVLLVLLATQVSGENLNAPAGPPSLIEETPASLYLVLPEEKSSTLDKDDVERLKAVLTPVFDNDDKKAKLAYGRNYKYLPPNVQFAFDLRFKNFSHAVEVLKESKKSSEEKEIWRAFVEKQPKDIGEGLCELIKSQGAFPRESYGEERSKLLPWVAAMMAAQKDLEEKRKLTKFAKDINENLAAMKCFDTKTIWTKGCPAFSEDEKKNLLAESFLDTLRNAQRRSSAYIRGNKRNDSKIAMDPDGFNRLPLLGFYGGVLSTSFPTRNQVHRRIRGIAKDMRADSLYNRAIGAIILEDQNDVLFVKRMRQFAFMYPFVAVINNLETRLASCALPDVKGWRAPK